MIELRIQGMTCQHCVRAVSEALAGVSGVVRVESLDLNTGSARVQGDADMNALIAAVKTAGYDATPSG